MIKAGSVLRYLGKRGMVAERDLEEQFGYLIWDVLDELHLEGRVEMSALVFTDDRGLDFELDFYHLPMPDDDDWNRAVEALLVSLTPSEHPPANEG